MIKRLNLFFLGLLMISVFFVGCTSQKHMENFSKSDSIESSSPANLPVITPIKTQVSPISTIKTSEIGKNYYFLHLFQNETARNHLPDNTSYDLSIGDVIFRIGGSSGNVSFYITKINITAKNSGINPIGLDIKGVSFSDDSGNGCSYEMPTWCSLVYFNRINPGESQTKTANVTFSSKKDYEYLSSKQFEYEVEIDEENLGLGTGNGGNRNSWIIEMKNST